MTVVARNFLPNRRECENVTFEWNNKKHTYTVGLYPDGSIAEVFINAYKASCELDFVARDGAIATSIALQHGVPLVTLAAAVTRDGNGEPSTIVGKVLNLIAQEIRT